VNANQMQTPKVQKKLAYLVSDLQIRFWNIMAKGIQNKAR